MKKIKLLTIALMSLLLTFTPMVQSNAKSCSTADQTRIDEVALAMVYTYTFQTQERYAALTKKLETAISKTKNSKLKAKLVKLKREIFNEVVANTKLSATGPASNVLSEIQDMKKYSLC